MNEILEVFLNIVKGKVVEFRPLFTFWRQFPLNEQSPKELAEAHIDFYNNFKFDFLKISPPAGFLAVDFGCKLSKQFNDNGMRDCENYPIKSLCDWEEIEEISPLEGFMGKQLELIKIIHRQLECVPKIIPLWTPLKLAHAIDHQFQFHFKKEPNLVMEGVRVLYHVIEEFALSAVDMGANGVFIESSPLNITEESLIKDEFLRFDLLIYRKLLQRVRHYSDFVILRIETNNNHFGKILPILPSDGINWDSKKANLGINAVSKIYNGVLVTGISNEIVVDGNVEDIREETYDLIKQSYNLNNRLIIAPNNTLSVSAPRWKLEIIGRIIKNEEVKAD